MLITLTGNTTYVDPTRPPRVIWWPSHPTSLGWTNDSPRAMDSKSFNLTTEVHFFNSVGLYTLK